MAITASQIQSTNTLEQLRTEFNNLRDDVSGLESGTLSFSAISTTSISGTTLNVAEDGTIIFEGATDDAFETTLTVVDPTADRTVTLPNASGTVIISDSSTNVTTLPDDLLIKDAGTIGNASVADVMTLASTGIVTFKDDIVIKDGGTIGTGTTAGAITIAANGNVTLSGDLTISGDDLVMGTNTAGHLLIADGTNFNPTAVGDLSEISTIANDDVFLAVDTSGGGLKKVARSVVVAGLATSAALTNVVEDTTPQLGGDLDVNGNGLVSTSNGNIALTPNGTGVVRVDGSNGIDMESGAISIKNSGAESYVRFYCESSNAHYTQLQASPHSAYGGNVTVVLPAAATNLVGDDTTQTLTNKTITNAQVNTALLPASADGAALGSATKEFSDLFLADAGTIQFGNDQEITLTHVADTGLTLTHTASGDNTPIVLQLKSEEDAIIADEVIASLEFAAGDSDGTDGATVAAGIHAIAEGTFSASANATKLVFTTGVSETAAASATAKMTLSSAGLLTIADDFIIKDGGTIGVTSANDAMTISSAGIVTFKDDILIKDGGTIGVASAATAITIASTGIVTFVDDILIKDGGTIGAASDADSITIASDGVVTFSQKDVHDAGLSVKNGATSAGFIEFFEDSDNGTNKVTLIGPASTADVTLTLPAVTDTVATAGDITALAIALG